MAPSFETFGHEKKGEKQLDLKAIISAGNEGLEEKGIREADGLHMIKAKYVLERRLEADKKELTADELRAVADNLSLKYEEILNFRTKNNERLTKVARNAEAKNNLEEEVRIFKINVIKDSGVTEKMYTIAGSESTEAKRMKTRIKTIIEHIEAV